MKDKEKHNKTKKPTTTNNKKPKHNHPNSNPNPNLDTQQHQSKPTSDISFKPSSDVKGLKFGTQFIIKSFTVRRSRPSELSLLLNLNLNHPSQPSFPSTIAFIPTNFTILAHHAWHTLTLGLGTKTSKVVIFVFDTVAGKLAVDPTWPPELPLGEVNRKLVRGLTGWEVARFKFRKGCVTFYVFAVRRCGERGFKCGDDLRGILHSVVALRDFLDHTAMLALPNQRSISHYSASFDSSSSNGGRSQSQPVVAAH